MPVKFYLNTELFTEDYRETGINYTMYHAVRNRKEASNKLIDLYDVIWDYDIPEIVDTLMRMGETEFTISAPFSNLIKTLAEFEKYGITIKGMTEVNSSHKDWKTGNHERIPALLMKLN